jgi:hypothetical protein
MILWKIMFISNGRCAGASKISTNRTPYADHARSLAERYLVLITLADMHEIVHSRKVDVGEADSVPQSNKCI